MKNLTAASYKKLKTGNWGVCVEGPVNKLEKVLVTKKSGETKTEIVDSVIWSDGKVSVATIKKTTHSNNSNGGCSECCQTATRTAQLWEDCEYCGTEPVYV